MSKKIFTCPKCGSDDPYLHWQSLNACLTHKSIPEHFDLKCDRCRFEWHELFVNSLNLHGWTCGWCDWGRDVHRCADEYIDHSQITGHFGEPTRRWLTLDET